jgi:hypothetical protein
MRKGAGAMGQGNGCKKGEAECIRKKAYELWEKDGYKHGRDLNYWLEAENNLKSKG